MRGGTTAARGQRRRACRPPIAVRTPHALASQLAARTTPPPTITGRPRRLGSSRCSTEAKNESASACRVVAESCTNTCSHRRRSIQTRFLQVEIPRDAAHDLVADLARVAELDDLPALHVDQVAAKALVLE